MTTALRIIQCVMFGLSGMLCAAFFLDWCARHIPRRPRRPRLEPPLECQHTQREGYFWSVLVGAIATLIFWVLLKLSS